MDEEQRRALQPLASEFMRADEDVIAGMGLASIDETRRAIAAMDDPKVRRTLLNLICHVQESRLAPEQFARWAVDE